MIHFKKIFSKFISLANRCEVILCCQISPNQKEEIVEMIKKQVYFKKKSI